MIWRWLTCSSLLAAAAVAGSVSGNVTLRDSRVAAVSKHANYSGVVVSLVPLRRPAEPQAPGHYRMLQKDKMFMPHVLPVLTGSTVDFPMPIRSFTTLSPATTDRSSMSGSILRARTGRCVSRLPAWFEYSAIFTRV
jgi:hypothetical protein